jgi:hypothetical protein
MITKTRKRRYQKGGSKKPVPHCQCVDTNQKPCRKIALFGSLFCLEHAHCPPSPRNGSEPPFEPEKWNNREAVTKTLNCYAYAFNFFGNPIFIEKCEQNNYQGCREHFPQPGALNGDRDALNSVQRRNCSVVEKLMISDVPDIEKSSFYGQCPKGKSKIALVVDPGEDYHFYRLDPDGFWSHKDGSNKVKRFDALRRRIFNPATASRDYRWQDSDLNYEDFCGFYCVPRDHPILLGQGGPQLAAKAQQQQPHAKRVAPFLPSAAAPTPRRGGFRHHQTRRRLRSGLP